MTVPTQGPTPESDGRMEARPSAEVAEVNAADDAATVGEFAVAAAAVAPAQPLPPRRGRLEAKMLEASSVVEAMLEDPAMADALRSRNIAEIYRHLQKNGVSQRTISAMVGQAQSEISEVLAGRVVINYDTLAKIFDGLRIPRGRVGMAFCNCPNCSQPYRT